MGMGMGPGPESMRVGYAQADRLRRGRAGSFGGSEVGGGVGGASTAGTSAWDYKSQDDAGELDDVRSQYASTTSGVTTY